MGQIVVRSLAEGSCCAQSVVAGNGGNLFNKLQATGYGVMELNYWLGYEPGQLFVAKFQTTV